MTVIERGLGEQVTLATYEKEADLCRLFIACLPAEWTAYPETGGFDILLVRDSDGTQIGIEAKLRLNPKVLAQVLEGQSHYAAVHPGPDYRAVLVPPGKCGDDLMKIAAALGVTVVRMRENIAVDMSGQPLKTYQFVEMRPAKGPVYASLGFRPELPGRFSGADGSTWWDRCPDTRIPLPSHVPQIDAGLPAPIRLTEWKERAIKIQCLLEVRGFVTRRDFRELEIDISRWTQERWLRPDPARPKGWIATEKMKNLREQMPDSFEKIKADIATWSKDLTTPVMPRDMADQNGDCQNV